MGKGKDKLFAQVFTCTSCGEPQFILSLQDLREMGVNVTIIEDALREIEAKEKGKLN